MINFVLKYFRALNQLHSLVYMNEQAKHLCEKFSWFGPMNCSIGLSVIE